MSFTVKGKIISATVGVLAMLLWSPVIAATSSESLFAGNVAAVVPCLNVNNASVVVLKGGPFGSSTFVYQKGVSLGLPSDDIPKKGDSIYGFSTPGAQCIAFGVLGASNMITFYATTTPEVIAQLKESNTGTSTGGSASASGSSSGGTSGGASLSGLTSSLSGLITSAFGGSSGGISGLLSGGVSSLLGSTVGSVVSSVATKPFGGVVLFLRPCFNFTAWNIILGPPSPGSYVYQTGLSRSYLYLPPVHPGQMLLGVAGRAAVCDINPASDVFTGITGGTILFHGSSI